jgi:hypothetical protein
VYQVLFSQEGWNAVEAGDVHVKNGCLSDHPGVDLYYYGTKHELNCARGTPSNENFHLYLRQALRGPNTSPVLAALIIRGVSHKWNVRMQIQHRGMPDFGTTRSDILLQLKRLDIMLNLHDSKYLSIIDPSNFASTNEDFCFIPGLFQEIDPDPIPDLARDEDDGPSEMDAPQHELDDDDDDDDDNAEISPNCCQFRIVQTEREFNDALRINSSIPLMLPSAPTQDEVQLYKCLALSSVSSGGAGIDLRKMLSLWKEEVKKNSDLPLIQQKKIGIAYLESLSMLSEKMENRDNQAWSLDLIRPADKELRQVHLPLPPSSFQCLCTHDMHKFVCDVHVCIHLQTFDTVVYCSP